MTPSRRQYNFDEKAQDIRHMFEARLITRKEYGELIRKLERKFPSYHY